MLFHPHMYGSKVSNSLVSSGVFSPQYAQLIRNEYIGSIQDETQWYQGQVQNGLSGIYSAPTNTTLKPKEPKKESNMFGEIQSDVRGFIKAHKSLIYWVAILLLVDHFMFHGAFKAKLKSMMDKLIGQVEAKVNKQLES